MLHLAFKRIFDFTLSLGGIMVLSPIFLLIALVIKLESKGNVLFTQMRVGKGAKDFYLFKFRSMYIDSEKSGQLTVGMKDPRITGIGYLLRKFKIDELPQLLNVLIGNMSFVGPRPEVRKYVDLYSPEQLTVLTVKPGITDKASLKYFNENELLEKSTNPEQTYINEIMPEKLKINIEYIQQRSIVQDFTIIFKTIWRILHLS
jgi:lipopolysaccharide/colanic/teichoic acid biosynthesis glycosyltransferase